MVQVEIRQTETLGTVYVLQNETQAVSLSPFGARLLGWEINIADTKRDIVVGFDSLSQHKEHRYFGATIGPVAGRIIDGNFTLEDRVYQLETTENGHTLHSGALGLDQVMFEASTNETQGEASVCFVTTFKDPDNRFPGKILVKVTYTLTKANQLTITYDATTDTPTLFNPTNHGYFNLTGDAGQAINAHYLQINAHHVAAKKADVTTTGERLVVAETPYDFEQMKRIGEVALDDPFILDHEEAVDLVLTSPDEQVVLTVNTDAPAVILYTTGSHEEGQMMKQNQTMANRGSIAIETQGIPGSERYEQFPSIVLTPETPFHSQTTYELIGKE
ncbi:aldose epimerase family protein [Enterococcus bulliens]